MNWNDKNYTCLDEAILTRKENLHKKTLKRLSQFYEKIFSLGLSSLIFFCKKDKKNSHYKKKKITLIPADFLLLNPALRSKLKVTKSLTSCSSVAVPSLNSTSSPYKGWGITVYFIPYAVYLPLLHQTPKEHLGSLKVMIVHN